MTSFSRMRKSLAVNQSAKVAIVVMKGSGNDSMMCEKVRENLTGCSVYLKELGCEARERYFTKLKYDFGTKSLPDPYQIPDRQWKTDPCLWPELDFAQVYLYLIETPALFSSTAMKNYKSLQAYRYVESGHVQEVKYSDAPDSPYCFLKAGIIPSMRTKDKPHMAWVCLSKETADVYCAHCTCMAGLGETCSHVAAILFKVELGVRFGLTQTSVTSEACKWNKVFRNQIDPYTIEEIQHLVNTNRKRPVESVIPSGKDPMPSDEVIEALHKACPNASFFTLIPPLYPEQQTIPAKTSKPKSEYLPPLLTSLYEQESQDLSVSELETKSRKVFDEMTCSVEQIETLFNRTRDQNISPLWYAHRKGRVTGTKAHDILTRQDNTPPDKLVMKIMDYKSYDLSKKEAVRWGLDNEERARNIYTQHYKTLHQDFTCAQSGFLISSERPFFGATADGVVSCTCCGMGTLEVKCPFKHKDVTIQDAIEGDKDFCLDRNMHLKRTHRYFTQVQFQMYVYDTLYTDFVVLTLPASNPCMAVVRVERDAEFLDALVNNCDRFVLKNVVPELLTCRLKDQPSQKVPDDQTLWCLCNEPEYGKMVCCDGPSCSFGWFHYACVDIVRKPRGKWLCGRCKK